MTTLSRLWRLLIPSLPLMLLATPVHAQMPFYTDDTSVTETKTLHIEVFDEFDGLQSSQFPDVRQNTANLRLNFSPMEHLELDIDAPYVAIYRAPSAQTSRGIGDTDLGAKWTFRDTTSGGSGSSASANGNDTRTDPTRSTFAVTFYVEFPTGDARQELGSGLTDYWLNFIFQKPLSEATRLNANLGILFAGNTSTGAVGIETRHGQVYTGGLSLLHDVTSRLTLGGEVYGGVSDGAGQDKTQLQLLLGAQYAIRDGLTLCLGILGGRYGGTPQIGGQIGFAVDLPTGHPH